MDFFVSYSEQDRDLAELVSEALALHGTVSGRAAVEAGGLELIHEWAAEHNGGRAAVICLISHSYAAGGSEIANAPPQTDGLIWINVYLDNDERTPAALARPGVMIAGDDRAAVALRLEIVFETLFSDPALDAPMRESGSLGNSRSPEPMSLGELLERRARAESYRTEMATALERPNFEAYAQPAPTALPEGRASLPPLGPAPIADGRSIRLIRWLAVGGAILLGAIALKGWVSELLAGAGLMSQGMVQPVPAQTGRVDMSAFAPEGGAPGQKALVQVLLHDQADLRRAGREARLADPDAARRMTATLTQDIALGQVVTVMLEGDDLSADEPVQRIVWRGDPVAAQFLVQLPSRLGHCYLRCLLLVDTMPVGSLRFALRVTEKTIEPKVEMRGDDARRYRRAFLSYASADRAEVLKRVQGLRAAGIDFFQDILSLEPGEQWEQRLYDEIDRCDLFLLFWSSNAAASEWVTRETDRAVARQHASTVGVPEITPVIIEGPPVAAPIPSSLRHLHFNDYLMLAAMSETRP